MEVSRDRPWALAREQPILPPAVVTGRLLTPPPSLEDQARHGFDLSPPRVQPVQQWANDSMWASAPLPAGSLERQHGARQLPTRRSLYAAQQQQQQHRNRVSTSPVVTADASSPTNTSAAALAATAFGEEQRAQTTIYHAATALRNVVRRERSTCDAMDDEGEVDYHTSSAPATAVTSFTGLHFSSNASSSSGLSGDGSSGMKRIREPDKTAPVQQQQQQLQQLPPPFFSPFQEVSAAVRSGSSSSTAAGDTGADTAAALLEAESRAVQQRRSKHQRIGSFSDVHPETGLQRSTAHSVHNPMLSAEQQQQQLPFQVQLGAASFEQQSQQQQQSQPQQQQSRRQSHSHRDSYSSRQRCQQQQQQQPSFATATYPAMAPAGGAARSRVLIDELQFNRHSSNINSSSSSSNRGGGGSSANDMMVDDDDAAGDAADDDQTAAVNTSVVESWGGSNGPNARDSSDTDDDEADAEHEQNMMHTFLHGNNDWWR